MIDILGSQTISQIRDRYYAGVTAAELGFDYSEGDEDSLTGALGQALLTPPTLVQNQDGSSFVYSIYHHKIRGRGANAPEKRIGADGIFQLKVTDQLGGVIRQKGLLFQAKKRWRTKDALLGDQASKIGNVRGRGIVIDFAPNGYNTCDASLAAEAEGSKRKIEKKQFSRLANTLGDEFLMCKIGIEDLYYDPENEKLVEPLSKESGVHLVDTRIQRL